MPQHKLSTPLTRKGAPTGCTCEFVQFATVGVTLEIPAELHTAACRLDNHHQREIGKLQAQVLQLRTCTAKQVQQSPSGTDEFVDLEVLDQVMCIPSKFAPFANQMDALYTTALSAAVSKVREDAALDGEWIQLGTQTEFRFGEWTCTLYENLHEYLTAPLVMVHTAMQQQLRAVQEAEKSVRQLKDHHAEKIDYLTQLVVSLRVEKENLLVEASECQCLKKKLAIAHDLIVVLKC